MDAISLIRTSFHLAVASLLIHFPAWGQSLIIPDNTLGEENSRIIPNINGFPVELIDGGAIRGQNLFHSFEEFNVDAERGAYFIAPSEAVANIFSRVTGENASNIFGVLGTSLPDGSPTEAHLYFINPNGVLFGETGSLDIAGSFTATTADAILFGPDGMFSATEPTSPGGGLTIDPSAFWFNQTSPRSIVSQSTSLDPFFGFFPGLWLPFGETLTLLGGNVIIDGQDTNGGLRTFGGRINIGSIAGSGAVGIKQDGSLSFPTELARGDITLTNRAIIDGAFPINGNLALIGHHILLEKGSGLYAGIPSNLGFEDALAGDIRIDATGTLSLTLGSILENDVGRGGTGNGGNVILSAEALELSNGSYISASTFGNGNAGNISLDIQDGIRLDTNVIILSRVGSDAMGDGGDLNISAASLSLLGGQISTGVFGQGNGGNIAINTREFTMTDGRITPGGQSFDGGIYTSIEGEGTGTGGDIFLTTRDLSVRGNSQISTAISSRTIGDNVAGRIEIQANTITVDAIGVNNPQIFSGIAAGSFGRGGPVDVQTTNLNLLNSAQIVAGVRGFGLGGDIRIRAKDITLAGKTSFEGSQISTRLGIVFGINGEAQGGFGQAGNIDIQTNTLTLQDDAAIETLSDGQGDAGDVTIAANHITLDNMSTIFTSVTGRGNAGDIEVKTDDLLLQNGSQFLAFSEGEGAAGNISIRATDTVELIGFSDEDGIPTALFTDNEQRSVGAGGKISITANRFSISEGAVVDARTRNQEPGGNITISTNDFEAINGGQLITVSQSNGLGGTITVNARNTIRIDGSDSTFNLRRVEFGPNRIGLVDASSGLFVLSRGNGPAGNITLTAPVIELDNSGKVNAESASGDGGNITVAGSNLLLLRRGSSISTSAGTTQAEGDGGNISINFSDGFVIAPPEENSDITANAFTGRGGQVNITTRGLFGLELRPQQTPASDITASSEFGLIGDAIINSPDTSSLQSDLTSLPEVIVDTSQLLSGSCIARTTDDQGSFTITGRDGLPQRPDDSTISAYPTGTVQSTDVSGAVLTRGHSQAPGFMHPTGEIQEPDGVYQLPDGRLVLSRECD